VSGRIKHCVHSNPTLSSTLAYNYTIAIDCRSTRVREGAQHKRESPKTELERWPRKERRPREERDEQPEVRRPELMSRSRVSVEGSSRGDRTRPGTDNPGSWKQRGAGYLKADGRNNRGPRGAMGGGHEEQRASSRWEPAGAVGNGWEIGGNEREHT
jgi:hypothetical protein